jgi:hypothetical protein
MTMNVWLAAAVAVSLLAGAVACAAAEEAKVTCVKQPPTDRKNEFYPSNREPLAPSPLVKLPIGAIKPAGWLRHMLELEAAGMTGRLTEISPWCKAEGNAWLSPEGKGHSPWEEMPYWLKGFGDLGYVLGDERITKEARRWIDGIISSQREDGWFGPRANLTNVKGKSDIWPNMVALNALQSYYEYSGDKRVLDLMTKYFRWQLAVPDADFIVGSWQKVRGGDNLESVYWLYNRTGEAWLLDLAKKVHAHTDQWAEGVANWHGVNFCQDFREPAVFWMQAKEAKFRQAAYRNYDTVIGLYGQCPGGMFGADENCRRGYGDPRQGAEACSIIEFMHSFEMLMKITGDPLWADRCEEAAFNSAPCAQTPDLKGLHYLTAANQAVLDRENHAPGIENRGCMLAYDPHGYRCCQHNISHGWPYYAEELWLATPDGGLCASLYAASTVEARVGDGTAVRIAETTEYPFGEAIALAVAAPKAVRFPLYLRVPRWCPAPKVTLNGRALDVKAEPLAFIVIERTWADGDKVVLDLPMTLGVKVWEKNKNAVSVSRGPLAFSLAIGEKWSRYGGTDAWPAFEVFPTTPWNYGLEIDPAKPEASVEVVKKSGPVAAQPFTPEAAPIELKAKARKIPEWGLDRHGLVAVLQPSPAASSEPVETVRLIPMGCARLRIAAFPTTSAAAGANQWQETAAAKAALTAAASHCNEADTPDALSDGLLPKNSDDRDIPRLTWWSHKGTPEWVAYQFAKPRTVAWSDVYWFDDTGHGQCRLPASWQLLYKAGGEWKPVKLTDGAAYGVEKDKLNKVTFEPVETSEMRLEVKLRPDFSGGILEWRVGPPVK